MAGFVVTLMAALLGAIGGVISDRREAKLTLDLEAANARINALPEPSNTVVGGIIGQAELATINYGQLRSMLESHYPVLKASN